MKPWKVKRQIREDNWTCIAIAVGATCSGFPTSHPAYNPAPGPKALIQTANSDLSEAQAGSHHSYLLKNLYIGSLILTK